MMPPVTERLTGWWDEALHVTYTPAEAESKFGARIYREGQRPKNLRPLFCDPAAIRNQYGEPEREDKWMAHMKWDHAPEVAMVCRCGKCCGKRVKTLRAGRVAPSIPVPADQVPAIVEPVK